VPEILIEAALILINKLGSLIERLAEKKSTQEKKDEIRNSVK